MNRRHKLFGHLFSGRYKSLLVDGSGRGYRKSMCDYGEERTETVETMAEQIIAKELKRQ